MIPVGNVIESIKEASNAQNDDVLQPRIWRVLNMELQDLCREYSWKQLRKVTTLSFDTSGVDSTGLWLPSNLMGIDMVRDADNDYEFFERNRSDIEPEEWGYRYYTYAGSSTPLLTGEDVEVQDKGTTLVSSTISSAVTGGTTAEDEYIRIGDTMAFHKITDEDTLTISPAFYGENQTQVHFDIRPKETLKMVIIDKSEQVLLDRDVEVYYWEAPPVLWHEWQPIPLPSAEILELRTLRKIPESRERRPVNEREIKAALGKALYLNPDVPRSGHPRDRHNEAFQFNTNIFTRRG